MKPFSYARPVSFADALKLLSPTARPKGGGNDLLDLAKRGVSTPDVMVQVPRAASLRIPGDVDASSVLVVRGSETLAEIEADAGGAYRNAAPALRDAAREAATPQIRNTATVAGSLLQRPRCAYFRDPYFDCLKRGGKSCPARDGVHDEMAIFGNSACCATHPSNLATALLALDATAHVITGADAEGGPVTRKVRFDGDLFVAPETDPLRETSIGPKEILWFVTVPSPGRPSAYAEVNQKQSYDWASVACAVVLDVDGAKIRDARVALGAVAPVPLLSKGAADALRGKGLRDEAAWDAAASAACEGATPLPQNGHKVRQLRAVVRRAIEAAAARTGK